MHAVLRSFDLFDRGVVLTTNIVGALRASAVVFPVVLTCCGARSTPTRTPTQTRVPKPTRAPMPTFEAAGAGGDVEEGGEDENGFDG